MTTPKGKRGVRKPKLTLNERVTRLEKFVNEMSMNVDWGYDSLKRYRLKLAQKNNGAV